MYLIIFDFFFIPLPAPALSVQVLMTVKVKTTRMYAIICVLIDLKPQIKQ